MPRTASRPLPSGEMQTKEALFFVIVTSLSGLAILYYLDLSLFILGLISLFTYNVLYTLVWKPRLAFAAIPGAIPGALPILIGYAAANGNVFDHGGIYLFFVLFFWQMPHFWSLALRYSEDYKKGGIPTLPVTYGTKKTVFYIILWSLGYVGIALIAPLFLEVGPIYFIICVLFCSKVLWELVSFVKQPKSDKWLKFFLWVNFSLIALLFAAVADLWSIYLLIPLLT